VRLAESLGQHPWAWVAVVALGAYHGLNPGMGWLFAVSNGMQARRVRAVFLALPPIAVGHFLAMGVVLLPFAVLGFYVERVYAIQVAAAIVLILFGTYKLVSQRHPRFLARIGPAHLTLWSFLMATAHGAGLMLVPVVLGLYPQHGPHAHHAALLDFARGDLALTVVAATAHTASLVLTGGVLAFVVYRYVGLGLLRRSWINLDLVWAVLLIVVGAIGLAVAL
jgi:hypothetical protein